jgi:hypothetical protein
MKKHTVICLLFVLVVTKSLFAQVLFKEVSLGEQIEKSSLVLEGKVLSKKSFWNETHTKIYTVNTIEVYKVFKGEALSSVEVITPGGTVELDAQIVTPSLKLNKDDTGVFTLYDSNAKLDNKIASVQKQFEPYGSLQGFYMYDINNDIAINPFIIKHDISGSLYNEIKSYTKLGYIEVANFNLQKKSSVSNKSSTVLVISTFYPTTSTAGTKSVLTITGSDFGITKGKVGFSNADNAGASFIDALDSQVLSWTNSVITVEIPSKAGTGKIRIKHPDGTTLTSANNLTITYAQTNIVSDILSSGVNMAYPTQLINTNGSGGYTWYMTSAFKSLLGAEQSVTRAMKTWSCETQINWVLEGSAVGSEITNQHQSGANNLNVLAFDDSTSLDPEDDLPDTVLGHRTSYYSGCYVSNNGVTSLAWFVNEFDIIFDDETNWNFDSTTPNVSELDFESIALHELGHCSQLDHIINTNDIMHFAISKGEVLRSLGTDNIAIGNIVQNRSANTPICGKPLMTNYSGSCSLGIEKDELSNAINVYPNPTKGEFFIATKEFINFDKAVVYDIGGRLISSHDISNGPKTKTINLMGASKGIYFVNIYSDKAVITKKMVLE